MLLWSIRLNGTPESLVVRNAKRPQEEYTFFHIRPYIAAHWNLKNGLNQEINELPISSGGFNPLLKIYIYIDVGLTLYPISAVLLIANYVASYGKKWVHLPEPSFKKWEGHTKIYNSRCQNPFSSATYLYTN